MLVKLGHKWVSPKKVKSIHCYKKDDDWSVKNGRDGEYVCVSMKEGNDNFEFRGDQQLADELAARVNSVLDNLAEGF